MTDVTCPFCYATTGQKDAGYSPKGLRRYECLVCRRQYTPDLYIQMQKTSDLDRTGICLVCGKETTNPKFCSSSCSATYNNHVKPKRTKKQRFCKRCGVEVEGRATVCTSCRKKLSGSSFDWSTVTLVNLKAKYPNHIFSNILGAIARRDYRTSGRPQKCQRCGYNRYYEVCHIRAISSFPDDTPVSEISALDNLMALCRNCHWEFDHGLLSIEDIPDWK